MKKVQLKVNETNLIANLGQSFTSKKVLFRELAQNSRRAGATKIELTLDADKKLFIIKDDGKGIKDFQNLFTVAESGWDSEVQAKENPFGMGFFMAVFACENLKVESCGQELVASKYDILEKRELKVTPGAVHTGTIITLSGIDEGYLNFDEDEFKGFPVPVIVNGETVESEYSMEILDKDATLQRREFWFGTAYLPIEPIRNTYGFSHWFLQGLPLQNYGLRSFAAIIHLKSDEFKARMPDRMTLIDEDDHIDKIRETIFNFECEQIKEKKNDFDWLLENYSWVEAHKLTELFNPFDKVPGQFLAKASKPVAQASCNTEENQIDKVSRGHGEFKVISKKELMSKKIVHNIDFSYCDDFYDNNPNDVKEYAAHLFLYEADVFVIEPDCPKNHWLYSMSVNGENFVSTLKVSVKNEQACNVEQSFSDHPVVMADSMIIETMLGKVEVTKYPCLIWDETDETPTVVIPLTGYTSDIISQVCRFSYEDSFDETFYNKIEDRFNEWAELEEASRMSEEKMLEVKMSNFLREMPSLAGKTFMISFEESYIQDEKDEDDDELPAPRKIRSVIVKKP